jgi:hypothetical protein
LKAAGQVYGRLTVSELAAVKAADKESLMLTCAMAAVRGKKTKDEKKDSKNISKNNKTVSKKKSKKDSRKKCKNVAKQRKKVISEDSDEEDSGEENDLAREEEEEESKEDPQAHRQRQVAELFAEKGQQLRGAELSLFSQLSSQLLHALLLQLTRVGHAFRLTLLAELVRACVGQPVRLTLHAEVVLGGHHLEARSPEPLRTASWCARCRSTAQELRPRV